MASYRLLGVKVNPYLMDELLDIIKVNIDSRSQLIIASQNLHSIYIFHKNKAIRQLHERAIKRVDGMPLVFLGKLLGYPMKREHRITWVDLMYPLMERAELNSWKIFYLGADEISVSTGIKNLRESFPNIQITYRNGYFNSNKSSDENTQVIGLINNYQPDILIVGMGMPRQEKWILDNLDALHVPVIMTSGAAIEYVAGTVSVPPRWMGKLGLEWFYRLQENPKRFAFRYLIEPWYIMGLAGRDLMAKYILKREL